MTPDNTTCRGLAPLLALLVSACATTPPGNAPSGTLPGAQERASESTTTPGPVPTIPCAWSQTRGIAKLLAVAADTKPTPVGTWQFFPGDDVVFHPVPKNAGKGSEYKALLRRPMNGACVRPRLVLVAPV